MYVKHDAVCHVGKHDAFRHMAKHDAVWHMTKHDDVWDMGKHDAVWHMDMHPEIDGCFSYSILCCCLFSADASGTLSLDLSQGRIC